MRYRIGSDTNLLCVFTYYEAEYRLPDGSTRITRKWAHEHVYCTQANRGRRVHSISDTWHSPVGRGRQIYKPTGTMPDSLIKAS